jgi:hypothetical protein
MYWSLALQSTDADLAPSSRMICVCHRGLAELVLVGGPAPSQRDTGHTFRLLRPARTHGRRCRPVHCPLIRRQLPPPSLPLYLIFEEELLRAGSSLSASNLLHRQAIQPSLSLSCSTVPPLVGDDDSTTVLELSTSSTRRLTRLPVSS